MSTWTDKEPYPAQFIPALLADTWKRYSRKEKAVRCGKDGFPIFAAHPRQAEHELITAFVDETWKSQDFKLSPKTFAAGRKILALDPPGRVRVILALLERLPWFWKTGVQRTNRGVLKSLGMKGYVYDDPDWRWKLGLLLKDLFRSPPPFAEEDFLRLLTALAEPPDRELLYTFVTPKGLVRLAWASWPAGSLPAKVVAQLEELEKHLNSEYFCNRVEDRKVMDELGALLGKARRKVVKAGEAWSDAALTDLKEMTADENGAWVAWLSHCQQAESSKPAKKWLAEAQRLVDAIGRPKAKPRLIRWFELVARPRTVHRDLHPNAQRPDPDLLIDEHNATVLRGLAWSCTGWQDAEISSALSALAEVCFKKVRWLGPRCPRVGNACLYSLSTTSTEDAAAQLSRLDSTVKQPTAKKRIGKSLDAAATLTGQSREDLEEKSVPTFDLDLEGKVSHTIGDFIAQLRVADARDVEVTWSNRDGTALKSIPVELKRDHATELKQLQKRAREMEKMLAAQRVRIERLLMTERQWEFDVWRKRYLDQPLLAGITRRLIWHFQLGTRSSLGAWFQGKLVDAKGKPLDWLAPETRVRLWHSIGTSAADVAAWRLWLESRQVCQPFKQAHREIYALTNAEMRTRTYSNRFAAHILGQHQFAALCTQRGWKYSFMGGFDSQATPTLELPAWNLSAEFWVEPAGELANTGVARFLTTDQVGFLREGAAVPLTEVPALVFTEVMRDVDLFVGVASIGNDAAWQDRGEIEGAGDYWQTYSFGDLNASAKTRKEVLERLLPRLKIAKQCALDDKFLVVRGSLRSYRIHLGSSNIQMEPNHEYLCIVPGRNAAATENGERFLPFEGDRTLSIILSKAFLLAEDDRITDPTILSQIKRR